MSTAMMTLSAAPAHAFCTGHNTGHGDVGRVQVCVNADGTGQVTYSRWDEGGSSYTVWVLFGPEYVGICENGIEPENCTPDLWELPPAP